MMALGRRVRPMSRIPRSAACDSRKRKSMLCAFSELRAMVGERWGELSWEEVVVGRAVLFGRGRKVDEAEGIGGLMPSRLGIK